MGDGHFQMPPSTFRQPEVLLAPPLETVPNVSPLSGSLALPIPTYLLCPHSALSFLTDTDPIAFDSDLLGPGQSHPQSGN